MMWGLARVPLHVCPCTVLFCGAGSLRYTFPYQLTKSSRGNISYNYIMLGNGDRFSTFELKTTMPFHVVGQENKQVHLLADAKRDVENNGSRSYQVCRRLPPPFCSTMADEKTDLSNNEQVVVCLRCVDNSLNLSDCNELIH